MDPVLWGVLSTIAMGLAYLLGWRDRSRQAGAETISYWQRRVDDWVVNKLRPAKPTWARENDLTHIFFSKMDEELEEFKSAILNGDPQQIRLEWADLFITSIAAVHVHNTQATGIRDYVWLYDGLREKLPILEDGDWYYNTELGVFKRRK